MAIDDTWDEILKEAVAQGVEEKKGPVPGARLRQLIEKVAANKGITYPPAETPLIKFGKFLELHPGVVAVRREPNADVLVAPADRPELLVQTPSRNRPLPGIRADLFAAFTRILTDKTAWYDRSRDMVEWHSNDQKLDPNVYVKIPRTSIEDALRARNEFAVTQSDPDIRGNLEKAIKTPAAGFTAFSLALRESGLGAQWHQFRMGKLLDRIASWAKENGIPWQDAWITSSSRGEADVVNLGALLQDRSKDWRRALSIFAQSLDQEDLNRISVPLDIVLKALQQRH